MDLYPLFFFKCNDLDNEIIRRVPFTISANFKKFKNHHHFKAIDIITTEWAVFLVGKNSLHWKYITSTLVSFLIATIKYQQEAIEGKMILVTMVGS